MEREDAGCLALFLDALSGVANGNRRSPWRDDNWKSKGKTNAIAAATAIATAIATATTIAIAIAIATATADPLRG
jgi:hypothetical protein